MYLNFNEQQVWAVLDDDSLKSMHETRIAFPRIHPYLTTKTNGQLTAFNHISHSSVKIIVANCFIRLLGNRRIIL